MVCDFRTLLHDFRDRAIVHSMRQNDASAAATAAVMNAARRRFRHRTTALRPCHHAVVATRWANRDPMAIDGCAVLGYFRLSGALAKSLVLTNACLGDAGAAMVAATLQTNRAMTGLYLAGDAAPALTDLVSSSSALPREYVLRPDTHLHRIGVIHNLVGFAREIAIGTDPCSNPWLCGCRAELDQAFHHELDRHGTPPLDRATPSTSELEWKCHSAVAASTA